MPVGTMRLVRKDGHPCRLPTGIGLVDGICLASTSTSASASASTCTCTCTCTCIARGCRFILATPEGLLERR